MQGKHTYGDVFLDYGVTGNILDRPGLNSLIDTVKQDRMVTHVFIPRRNRLARPDMAYEGALLEVKLRKLGVWVIFMDKQLSPLRKQDRETIKANMARAKTDQQFKAISEQFDQVELRLKTLQKQSESDQRDYIAERVSRQRWRLPLLILNS